MEIRLGSSCNDGDTDPYFLSVLSSGSGFRAFYELKPPRGRVLAIGDIHGCKNTLNALLDKVGLTKEDYLFLLGDLINKGPDSGGVLDTVLRWLENGYSIFPLRGNHEDLCLQDLDAGEPLSFYPPEPEPATPSAIDKRVQLLRNLPYYYRVGQYLFVHAGFNTAIENPFEDLESMMWMRDFTRLNSEKCRVFHGHVPTLQFLIEQDVESMAPTINLDNACYRKEAWFMGSLCCLDITNKRLFFQKNVDDY